MKNNKSGLVLAEAMMAVALLAISVVVTGSIISSSVSTTYLSRNYLIGQNLATEAIEVVKTVRNTNWLLEPSDPACWLTLDPSGGCGAGEASVGDYVAIFANGAWSLSPETGNSTLYLVDGMYSHTGTDTAHPQFDRKITFTQVADESATFNVVVTWKEGQKDRRIERTMTIYNYY